MEITKVNCTIVDRDKIKAYADIIIDDCFTITGLKLIYIHKFFVSMPSRKRKDGTFADIAFPIQEETRKLIEFKILEAYEKKRSE